MTRGTGVNSVAPILEQAGYVPTRHGIYLKPVAEGELSLWVLATREADGCQVSLGAVAAAVNRFALGLLKKCSGGQIKPQFPAYVGPPIFIAEDKTFKEEDLQVGLPAMIADFESRFGEYSLDDWFYLARRLTPYTHAASLMIPAYLYLKTDREGLMNYLSNIHLAHPAPVVVAYLDKLREMIEGEHASLTSIDRLPGRLARK